jgi:uncharacterized metal-binding protein
VDLFYLFLLKSFWLPRILFYEQIFFHHSSCDHFIIGLILIEMEVSDSLFIILLLGIIVTSFRRRYLGLKPWWGAPLKDIPNYFKKP